MQDQRRGTHADFLRVFFQLRLHLLHGLRQHDGRGLVTSAGQLAVAASLHMHDVVGQHLDAQGAAIVTAYVPGTHAVAAIAGGDGAQIADGLGLCGHCRQQQGRKQRQQQRRLTNAVFHLASNPFNGRFETECADSRAGNRKMSTK